MKITNTTIFRMALQFAVLFETITVIALLSVYYTTLTELQDQIDSELKHELAELEETYHSRGIEKVTDIIEKREEYGEHLLHFYGITDASLHPIAGNSILIKKLFSINFDKDKILYLDMSMPDIDKEDENSLRIAIKSLPPGLTIFVAQSQNSLIELREHTFIALVIAVISTLVLVILSGAYMGRVVLSRIKRIDTGLDQAITSNFTEKLLLPEKNDEFKSLTIKLNLMLERIEKLIIGMRQVTDNVAHDLLSPLTRLRSRLEVTLLKSRSEKEYRETMEQVIGDTGELITTFNALLSIAQAEAKIHRDDWESVDLSLLLNELAELYAIVAEDKLQSFKCIITSPATIRANRQLLAQAISNLLENAIKYSSESGNITLELESQNNLPVITVTDNGPGIPVNDRERVLERFQRLDSARSSPGSGLGLSMVNAIAKLHNATLSLQDNHPGLKISLVFNWINSGNVILSEKVRNGGGVDSI